MKYYISILLLCFVCYGAKEPSAFEKQSGATKRDLSSLQGTAQNLLNLTTQIQEQQEALKQSQEGLMSLYESQHQKLQNTTKQSATNTQEIENLKTEIAALKTLLQQQKEQIHTLDSKMKEIHTLTIKTQESMCKIYLNNGFTDAAYKLYKKYIELNPNDEERKEELNNLYKNLKPIEEPENIEANIYKYKKGYCLYTELKSKDNLYIIKYGKVGVYNIFDSKQVTRRVLATDDVLNGYAPISKNNKYLSTTAIVLEDSIIQLIKKEDAMNLVQSDRTLRLYFVKMMSMRVYSTISRIRSFNANKIVSKFVIIIEALIKTELLFKSINKIKFQYNINDICSMIGIEYKESIDNEILKIKSLDISDEGYLMVNDVESFYKEYEIYKQRNTHKIETD